METKINEKEQLFEKDNLSGENKGALLPNQMGRYLTASSLTGDKVVNPAEEHLGEIKEIMLDLETGTIDYFVIEFGGFLGLGVKYFAIPFRLLNWMHPTNGLFLTRAGNYLKKHLASIWTIGRIPICILMKSTAIGDLYNRYVGRKRQYVIQKIYFSEFF